MRRVVFAVVMAILFFAILNFIYCNLDAETFGYKLVLKFNVPYIMSVKSIPLPIGFIIMASFCIGMVAVSVFEALPSLFKTLEIRAKNKRIRELEREISVLRDLTDRKDPEDERQMSFSEKNQE